MRASIVSLFCTFAGVIASPVKLVERDTAIIEMNVRTIQASLQNLVTLIQGLDTHRGPDLDKHINMIVHHGQELSDATHRGASDIQRGPAVGMVESAKLITPVSSLSDANSRAMDAWVASRQTIYKSGGKQAVYNIILRQRQDSKLLSDAMIAKLPVTEQWIGTQFYQAADRGINRALDYFKPDSRNW